MWLSAFCARMHDAPEQPDHQDGCQSGRGCSDRHGDADGLDPVPRNPLDDNSFDEWPHIRGTQRRVPVGVPPGEIIRR